MASAREMRLRIRSVKNIAQVTRALQTLSASKVRRAIAVAAATRPYSEKAWKVLVHLARQPGKRSLHPLLQDREQVKSVLVIMVTADRGQAGPFVMNIVRHTLTTFLDVPYEVRYIPVGRKGRDMLLRRRKNVIAEFSNLPAFPSYGDISPIGRLAIDEFLSGEVDQVYIAYTEFKNMITQIPVMKQLLPLEVDHHEAHSGAAVNHGVFTYEPDQTEILDQIIRRFTAVQVHQAVLSSLASEHAARMVAMRNATENAVELVSALELVYNKARQQSITNDILDIVGGAEALAASS
ncbi:MAG TPA: ATP synthase F1 subunit gamma [Anaerolineaceae bacterium]|nr:ATP synthase F1 subunit gamma [Anaerolineaceae bacterium]